MNNKPLWEPPMRLFLNQFVADAGDIEAILEQVDNLLQEQRTQLLREEKEAWLRGERCNECGREEKHEPLSNMCADCWKDA